MVSVSWTPLAAASRSAPIAGKPGRYRSVAIGATAASSASDDQQRPARSRLAGLLGHRAGGAGAVGTARVKQSRAAAQERRASRMPPIGPRDARSPCALAAIGLTGVDDASTRRSAVTWDDGDAVRRRSWRPGVYAYVQPDGGWMVNNCGVVVDGAGSAVLVDTTSTEKRNRAVLAEVGEGVRRARRRPSSTPTTTPTTPTATGSCPRETLVIGHEKCRDEVLAAGLEATKVITAPDYGDLTLRPPELTFSDRMTLHLLDFPVELRHVGRAHTSNDVLVWLPEQRVLFAGDLAFAGGQPFVLEGSVAGFRDAIAQMRALGARGAGARPRPGLPRRRGRRGCWTAMDAYVAYVARRRRRRRTPPA